MVRLLGAAASRAFDEVSTVTSGICTPLKDPRAVPSLFSFRECPPTHTTYLLFYTFTHEIHPLSLSVLSPEQMPVATPKYPAPLQSSRSLEKLGSFDLTPSIGTEFPPNVKLQDLLDEERNPTAIRDLAILVSLASFLTVPLVGTVRWRARFPESNE